jgi:hypothetical protein
MEPIPTGIENEAEKLKEIGDRAREFLNEARSFDLLLEEQERAGLRGLFDMGDYSLNTLVNNLAVIVEQDVLSQTDIDEILPFLRQFDFSIDRVGVVSDDRPDDLDSLDRLNVQCGKFANSCYELYTTMGNSQMEMFRDILPVLNNMVAGLDKITAFTLQRKSALEDYMSTR